MNYTFRADGSGGAIPRRPRNACDQCRKRKQRCYCDAPRLNDVGPRQRCLQCRRRKVYCSLENLRPPSTSIPSEGGAQQLQKQQQQSNAVKSPTPQVHTPPHEQPPISKFIGDLCPEARLVSRTRPSSPNTDRERDHLGVWCRDSVLDRVADPKLTAANSLQRYVDVIREFEVPDEIVCEALIGIYFSTIHQFIPLVDEVVFRNERACGKLSLSLLLAVLLASCRDSRAKPHLWFPKSGLLGSHRLLQTREFAQRIYTHLTSLLKAEAETDRVTLIQVHALMSLHCEGPAGNEVASLNLVTAIHYLQVLGMHLPRADETDKSGKVATIFWSVWSLDRLNAAYNGRPTIIHERDMANKAAFTCNSDAERKELAPFMVFLKLTELLDRTISYYRPVAEPTSTGWEEGFPSFEEVMTAEYRGIQADLIHVLEVYYHAIAILTSRIREWNPVTASNASSVRQALSTLRILEMAESLKLMDLPALPIIPYAMTLCLTVIYRQCRESLSSLVSRSAKHLVAACGTLDDLASQWWTAEAVAKLGRRAVEKITQGEHRSSEAGNGQLLRSEFHRDVLSGREQSKITRGSVDRTNNATPTQHGSIIAPNTYNSGNVLSPAISTPGYEEWVPSNARNESNQYEPCNAVDDYFLLSSIPNLIYPEAGVIDDLFNDISLYDGFGTLIQDGSMI